MNIRVANDEMALMLPANQSRFAPGGEYDLRATPVPSLASRVAGAFRRLLEIPRRRAVIDELATLTDRELADIGLTRDSLSEVFNPEFAAARAQDDRRGRLGRAASA